MSRQLDHLLRFARPSQLCSVLPGSQGLDAAVVARLFGVEPAEYAVALELLRNERAQAVQRLLGTAEFKEVARGGALASGGPILTVGDSLTADALSWSELLSLALAEVRRLRGVQVVNAGVSGNTTADTVASFIPLCELEPTLIVFLVGTNDARRHGWNATRPLIMLDQTRANLLVLRQLARERTAARVVWMTPPPVIEGRQRAHWLMQAGEIWYANTDLARIADVVRTLPGGALDLWPLFDGAGEGLYMDDGVHLNPDGQIAVASAVLNHLARTVPRE